MTESEIKAILSTEIQTANRCTRYQEYWTRVVALCRQYLEHKDWINNRLIVPIDESCEFSGIGVCLHADPDENGTHVRCPMDEGEYQVRMGAEEMGVHVG